MLYITSFIATFRPNKYKFLIKYLAVMLNPEILNILYCGIREKCTKKDHIAPNFILPNLKHLISEYFGFHIYKSKFRQKTKITF